MRHIELNEKETESEDAGSNGFGYPLSQEESKEGSLRAREVSQVSPELVGDLTLTDSNGQRVTATADERPETETAETQHQNTLTKWFERQRPSKDELCAIVKRELGVSPCDPAWGQPVGLLPFMSFEKIK